MGRPKERGNEVPILAARVDGREILLDVRETGRTVVADRFEAKAPADVVIERIFVEEGQRIGAGDSLVKFANEENQLRLNMARAEVREAEAGLEDANYQQANRDRLIEEERLSEVEAEGLEDRITLYQATLDRAKAEIELLERALEQTEIKSPIMGTVTRRLVSEGASVSGGEVLVEILRLSPMHFVFQVPVDAAANLDRAREVEVKFPLLGGRVFAGEVLNIGGELTAGGRGVEVKLGLPNEEGILKGEMEGEVVLSTQKRQKIFPLPEVLVERTERSTYLFRVDGDRVKRIPVELGEEREGRPTVVKGLRDGDLVVVSSRKKLKDGDLVEVETAP